MKQSTLTLMVVLLESIFLGCGTTPKADLRTLVGTSWVANSNQGEFTLVFEDDHAVSISAVLEQSGFYTVGTGSVFEIILDDDSIDYPGPAVLSGDRLTFGGLSFTCQSGYSGSLAGTTWRAVSPDNKLVEVICTFGTERVTNPAAGGAELSTVSMLTIGKDLGSYVYHKDKVTLTFERTGEVSGEVSNDTLIIGAQHFTPGPAVGVVRSATVFFTSRSPGLSEFSSALFEGGLVTAAPKVANVREKLYS